MAVPNLGEISAITFKYFLPKMVDNIFNSNALLQRWRGKDNYATIDGGTDLNFPVAFASTTASGWYNGADTLDVSANDQVDAATFDWKQTYASILITRLDELKNSGKAQVINFVKAKVQLAEKTLADGLGTGIYNNGSVANELVGLRAGVLATGTYGGIDSSTNSWWQSQVDSGTTTLSMGTMQSLYGDATIDNDKPSVLVGTQDNFDRFYGLLQPQQRFSDSETAKGGFSNLMFNGRPFIVDSHVPADHIYYLNENYIGFKVHKDEDFRFEPFQKPTNQNVSFAKVYWTGALYINNRRMHGVMSAITS